MNEEMIVESRSKVAPPSGIRNEGISGFVRVLLQVQVSSGDDLHNNGYFRSLSQYLPHYYFVDIVGKQVPDSSGQYRPPFLVSRHGIQSSKLA